MEAEPLAADVIYFDEASTSWPKAPGVLEAMAGAVERPPLMPGCRLPGRCALMWECRERLAELLKVPFAERISLTAGATHAINIALFGFGKYRGSRVITSCAEHEATLTPLLHLRECRRIHLTIVRLDTSGGIDQGAFRAALAEGASLVVLTHACHVTGRVFDVAPLFALAKAAGAHTLLDASQSIGEVPVHPEELGADMVAFSGHKRLRGPSGTGGLYVAPHLVLSSVLASRVRNGGEAADSDASGLLPAGFDTGRPDEPAFAGLCEALRWHKRHGEACRREGRRLGHLLRRGVGRIPGVRMVGDARHGEYLPIISFRVKGWDAQEIAEALVSRFGIRCAAGLHAAPLVHKALGSRPDGTIRFSVSGFNTQEQVGQVLRALRRVVVRTRVRVA